MHLHVWEAYSFLIHQRGVHFERILLPFTWVSVINPYIHHWVFISSIIEQSWAKFRRVGNFCLIEKVPVTCYRYQVKSHPHTQSCSFLLYTWLIGLALWLREHKSTCKCCEREFVVLCKFTEGGCLTHYTPNCGMHYLKYQVLLSHHVLTRGLT